jgi:hypothetical protein
VYDEEDDLIQEATEFEVAVEQFESKSEDGEVLFFEKTNELTGMRKFIEEHRRDGVGSSLYDLVCTFVLVVWVDCRPLAASNDPPSEWLISPNPRTVTEIKNSLLFCWQVRRLKRVISNPKGKFIGTFCSLSDHFLDI